MILLVAIATCSLLMVPYTCCSSWISHFCMWPIKYLHDVTFHSGICPPIEQRFWAIVILRTWRVQRKINMHNLNTSSATVLWTVDWLLMSVGDLHFRPTVFLSSSVPRLLSGDWNNNPSPSATITKWTICKDTSSCLYSSSEKMASNFSEKMGGWALSCAAACWQPVQVVLLDLGSNFGKRFVSFSKIMDCHDIRSKADGLASVSFISADNNQTIIPRCGRI